MQDQKKLDEEERSQAKYSNLNGAKIDYTPVISPPESLSPKEESKINKSPPASTTQSPTRLSLAPASTQLYSCGGVESSRQEDTSCQPNSVEESVDQKCVTVTDPSD